MRKIVVGAMAVFILLSIMAASGCAKKETVEKFPSRPITSVCIYAAGGDSDAWQRITVKHMEKYLNVPINVENIAGASGMTALASVNKRPADGYTICYADTNLTTAVAKGIQGPDIRRENVLLGGVYHSDMVFGARADSKYKTFQDFVNDCKARPGKIKVGGATLAGASSMPLFLLKDKLGIDFEIVPYGSTAALWPELLGGRIEVTCAPWANFVQYVDPSVKADLKLVGLAAFSDTRSKVNPNVPTAKEMGIDVVWKSYFSFAVRKDTPTDRVNILTDAFQKTAIEPEYTAELAKLGREEIYGPPNDVMDYYYWNYDLVKNLLARKLID